jgi:hypothetical protein
MLGLDAVSACEPGDARGDPRRPRATATREREPFDRLRQECGRGVAERRRRLHQRITCRSHARPHAGRRLAGRPGELAATWSRHRQHEVEAVEQRARQPLAIPIDALRAAHAGGGGIAASAARAGVRTYSRSVPPPFR